MVGVAGGVPRRVWGAVHSVPARSVLVGCGRVPAAAQNWKLVGLERAELQKHGGGLSAS